MIKEALEYLKNMALEGQEARQYIFNSMPFTNKQLYPLKEFEPDTLTTFTLDSVYNYIVGSDYEAEEMGWSQLLIHVVSPTKVMVFSKLRGSFNQRFLYLQAICPDYGFNFGGQIDIEKFTIGLQSLFVDNTDRNRLLEMLANIKDEHVKTFGDNGICQSVVVKDGIDLRKEVIVPNPVTLRPFRTFPEIEQPCSPFIFRMHQNNGKPPLCSLIEADGGLWEIEAIKSIKNYLRSRLAATNAYDIEILA